ncbi:uncharacterized protein E0L32_007803 [Thyridium curvatum]|uniref:Uncharacterized protein n=1 Tax=Thyridium curvatum TaxID=1093900 RepID=A0A507ANV3_9PEZI|nr:uncharacterized protein E0L32_007803 [Thyridium curvatum]TPX11592.1 hypothetical protein E0L32_007803 [Thyridium curvatum]
MPGIPKSDRCKYCKQRKIKPSNKDEDGGGDDDDARHPRGPQVQNDARGHGDLPPDAPAARALAFVPALWAQRALAHDDGRPRRPAARLGARDSRGRQVRAVPVAPDAGPPPRADRRVARAAARGRVPRRQPREPAPALQRERGGETRAAAAAGGCGEDLLDLKTYGRALRSVQAALADPEQMYDAATLAAVSILQRVEVPFCVCVETYLCCMCVDCGLSLQNSFGGGGVGGGGLRAGKRAHTEGIYTLMERRGPAALAADELELHLALDNLGQIMTWSILSRKPNIYTLPEWSDAIMSALEAGAVANPVLSASYRMVLQLAQWPVLVHDLERILQDPLHPDATMAAMKLAEDASALNVTMLEHIRLYGGASSADEKATGSCLGLRETPCPAEESPFGARYDFPDLTTAQCHCYTALVLIAVNRILASALRFLGSDDPLLEVQNRELSRRIWLALPYARRFKPLGCVFFVTPLVVSYESAVGAEEKRHVIDALYDLEEYKGKAAAPERWTEENILRVCMALTGRMPLDQATDLGVELRSDGAR